MSRLDELKAKIDAEKAAVVAAKAALSSDDIEEIELRKQLREAENEREAAEQAKRNLDLEQREEAVRDRFPGGKIDALAIRDYPDTFIIMHDAAGYRVWRDQLDKAHTNKKISKTEAAAAYAVKLVVDWNGETDFDGNSELTHRLSEYLYANGGIVDAITNAAVVLAGLYREDRKS